MLASVAALAATLGGTAFTPYLDSVASSVVGIMVNDDPARAQLRAAATSCAGKLAAGVGARAWAPAAAAARDAAVRCLGGDMRVGIDGDAVVRESAFHFFSGVAVLAAELDAIEGGSAHVAALRDAVLPAALAVAMADEGVELANAIHAEGLDAVAARVAGPGMGGQNADDGDDDDDIDGDGTGSGRVRVRTSAMDTKTAAIICLGEALGALPAASVGGVLEKSVEIVMDLSDHFSGDVQCAAISASAGCVRALVAVKENPGAVALADSLTNLLVRALVQRLRFDEDVDAAKAAADALGVIAGVRGALTPVLAAKAAGALITVFSRRALCLCEIDGSDDEGGDDGSDEGADVDSVGRGGDPGRGAVIDGRRRRDAAGGTSMEAGDVGAVKTADDSETDSDATESIESEGESDGDDDGAGGTSAPVSSSRELAFFDTAADAFAAVAQACPPAVIPLLHRALKWLSRYAASERTSGERVMALGCLCDLLRDPFGPAALGAGAFDVGVGVLVLPALLHGARSGAPDVVRNSVFGLGLVASLAPNAPAVVAAAPDIVDVLRTLMNAPRDGDWGLVVDNVAGALARAAAGWPGLLPRGQVARALCGLLPLSFDPEEAPIVRRFVVGTVLGGAAEVWDGETMRCIVGDLIKGRDQIGGADRDVCMRELDAIVSAAVSGGEHLMSVLRSTGLAGTA